MEGDWEKILLPSRSGHGPNPWKT